MTEPAEALHELAYRQIKHMIITLALRPGQYVNESRLSDVLGIGKNPVHMALRRLDHESMVEVIPRKGVIVRPISLQEVMDVIDLRIVNEMYCARLAAARASDAELAELDEMLDRLPSLLSLNDRVGLMDLDRTFHLTIARSAKNRVLADTLSALHERTLRFWFIALPNERQLKQLQDEHRALYEALRRRDPDAAAEAVRTHLLTFRSDVAASSW